MPLHITRGYGDAAPTALTTTRPARLAPRLAALAAGAICLLMGLDAALLRLALPSPISGARLAELHGPLMLIGFFGTVISLERAVALRQPWAFLSPYTSAAGALLLLLGVPLRIAGSVSLLGALSLLLIYWQLSRRALSHALDCQAMGALSLTLGTLLWWSGWQIPQLIALWLLFPTLTIIGERLELARVSFLSAGVEETVRALCAASLLGACLLTVTPWARLALGPSLLALAVLMTHHDIARRTIRASGAPRFTAACMLAAYVWLGVAGLVWSLAAVDGSSGDLAYDVGIHAITVGFAFSMILAHAPTIVPAIIHRRLPYHRLMWVPAGALHLGLALRVAALSATAPRGWQAGGLMNVVAILAFLLLSAARTLRSGSLPGSSHPHTRA